MLSDATSMSTEYNIIQPFVSWEVFDDIWDIARSAQEEEWTRPTKKKLLEFVYSNYNIASLADLEKVEIYGSNHTGVNMTLNVVDNYNLQSIQEELNLQTRKKADYFFCHIGHIMRFSPFHNKIEFDPLNIIENGKAKDYKKIGLLFLNSHKKDSLIFLDQQEKIRLKDNLLVYIPINRLMSFQVKRKDTMPLYCLIMYFS